MSTDTDCTRALSDRLRKQPIDAQAVITPGIAALGAKAVHRLVQTIAVFDDFCRANDPDNGHDFGAYEFDGVPVVFKIDHHPRQPWGISSGHSNPTATARVITLMLAEESYLRTSARTPDSL